MMLVTSPQHNIMMTHHVGMFSVSKKEEEKRLNNKNM